MFTMWDKSKIEPLKIRIGLRHSNPSLYCCAESFLKTFDLYLRVAELIESNWNSRIDSMVFCIVYVPKLRIDWFVIIDWHVFKRMKSFLFFSTEEKQNSENPFTITFICFHCNRDRESLDPFINAMLLCILPSTPKTLYGSN